MEDLLSDDALVYTDQQVKLDKKLLGNSAREIVDAAVWDSHNAGVTVEAFKALQDVWVRLNAIHNAPGGDVSRRDLVRARLAIPDLSSVGVLRREARPRRSGRSAFAWTTVRCSTLLPATTRNTSRDVGRLTLESKAVSARSAVKQGANPRDRQRTAATGAPSLSWA